VDPILTERLRFRPVTPRDAGRLHVLYRDATLMRYITGRPRTVAETRARLARDLRHHRRHGFGLCVAEWLATGEVVGRCGIEPVESEGGLQGEMAWMFKKAWWGRGLGTESARALIRFAAEELRLTRLFARADPENHASIAIMERVGMIRVGLVGRDVEYEMPLEGRASRAPP